jgi:hypothetical protein
MCIIYVISLYFILFFAAIIIIAGAEKLYPERINIFASDK